MNRIEKFLARLDAKHREQVLPIVALIVAGQWQQLNVKKLKGYENRFRVRVGKFRIIFDTDNGVAYLRDLDFRDEDTYKNL